MWGVNEEKEATLREVLAEVSILDVGRMLKQAFLGAGCFAIFSGIIFFADAAVSETTGWRFSNLGIPDWVIWIVFAWMGVAATTTEKSFHEAKMSWYFPKLNWFTSLLFAAYLVGFFQLMTWVYSLPRGLESAFAFGAIWFAYFCPFLMFLAAINIGYDKVIAKRQQEKENGAGAKQPAEAYSQW
jgi:hypothetical protein